MLGIDTIAYLVTLVLGVLGGVFGSYAKWKKKATAGINLLNEVKKAYADNKITNDEMKKIIDRYKELTG